MPIQQIQAGLMIISSLKECTINLSPDLVHSNEQSGGYDGRGHA